MFRLITGGTVVLGNVGRFDVLRCHLKSLFFYFTWAGMEIAVLEVGPVVWHHCIVVIPSMIAHANRLQLFLTFLGLFMKSTHRLARIRVNFNRPPIYFRQCLDFNIVSPDFVLTFAGAVLLNASINLTINEVLEVVVALQHIIHTFLS